MSTEKTTERFHALDSLRASMMLLGIVMHAGLSYGSMPRNPIWAFKDVDSTWFSDAMMHFSGLFRMAVFFLLAGFFAGLLFDKRGSIGLLKNRTWRILVPLALFWVVTFFTLRLGFAYAGAPKGTDPWDAVAESIRSGSVWKNPYPIHLWFLEYLLLFYFVCVPIVWCLVRLVPGSWRTTFRETVGSILGGGWALPVLVLVTVPVLMLSPMPKLGTPLSFWPEWSSGVGYGLFFLIGWVLFSRPDLLNQFAKRAWLYLILGFVLMPLPSQLASGGFPGMPGGFGPPGGMRMPEGFGPPPLDLFGQAGPPFPKMDGDMPFPFPKMDGEMPFAAPLGMDATPEGNPVGPRTGRRPTMPGTLPLPEWLTKENRLKNIYHAATNALITWLLVFGSIGLFVRYLNRPIGWIRYLTDASYWLYLVHFPLMIWIPIALADWSWPAWIKLTVTVVSSLMIMLLVYEIAVRRTWLGLLLNGKNPSRLSRQSKAQYTETNHVPVSVGNP